jgi:chorismate-pyruvate lyase
MEELDIPAVLARLDGHRLGPVERVLAAHTGTVQLLLSLYFGSPVDVALVEQTEEHGEIRRRVSLVVRSTGQEACFARSVIPLSANRPEVLADVREGVLGIGQIAVKHRIPTERRIRGIKVTPSQIARRYIMQGPGLYYAVTEVFPRELYR